MEEQKNTQMSPESLSAYFISAQDFQSQVDASGSLVDAARPIKGVKPIDGDHAYAVTGIEVPSVDAIKQSMKALRTDLINIRHNVAMNDIYAGSDTTMSELWSSNSNFYKARLDETEANLVKEMEDLRKRKAAYEMHQEELKRKEEELDKVIKMFNHYSNEGSMPGYEVSSYMAIENELQDERAKVKTSLDSGIDKVVSLPTYKDEVKDAAEECMDAIFELLRIYHSILPKSREELDGYSAGLINLDFEEAARKAMADEEIHKLKGIVNESTVIIDDPSSTEIEKADAEAAIKVSKDKITMTYDRREVESKEHKAKAEMYEAMIEESNDRVKRLQSDMQMAIETIQTCIDNGVEIDGEEVNEAYVYNKSAEEYGGSEDQVQLQKAYKEAREIYVKASQDYLTTQSEILLKEDEVKASYIKATRNLESANRSLNEAEDIKSISNDMINKLEKAIALHTKTIDFANHEIAGSRAKSEEIALKIEESKPSDWDGELKDDGSPMTTEEKEAAHKEQVSIYKQEQEDLDKVIEFNNSSLESEQKMKAKAEDEKARVMSDKDKAEQKIELLSGSEEGSISSLEAAKTSSGDKVLDYANVKMEMLNNAEATVTKALVDLEGAEGNLSELEGTFASDIQFKDRVDELDGEGDLELITKDSKGESNLTEIVLPKWLAKLFKKNKKSLSED